MKVVIITVPMKRPDQIEPIQYPVDGNKAIEYEKPVRCPVNSVLAETMKKGEQVRVIYIMTRGTHSECEQNRKNFIDELEEINAEIGAALSYDMVEIDFLPTKQTYNKLLTDLTEKIPENAEIFTDITFGFKPVILSLFCALRFVEEFRDAIVQYIVYGKAEFNKEGQIERPMLFDITSLYYLFKLIGNIGNTDFDTASKMLKDFFAL
jgi:translation initiation factor 2B subunit (eIF-2B alpha/beta/delta family)